MSHTFSFTYSSTFTFEYLSTDIAFIFLAWFSKQNFAFWSYSLDRSFFRIRSTYHTLVVLVLLVACFSVIFLITIISFSWVLFSTLPLLVSSSDSVSTTLFFFSCSITFSTLIFYSVFFCQYNQFSKSSSDLNSPIISLGIAVVAMPIFTYSSTNYPVFKVIRTVGTFIIKSW